MREIWMRVGMTLKITEEEEKALFSCDGSADQLIKKIVSEGRATADGNTYIPQDSIKDYNEKYGTNYEEDDWDFGW